MNQERMKRIMDMLVNLNHLPPLFSPDDVRIVRVLPTSRQKLLTYVREHFVGWVNECEQALSHQPNTCFAAVRSGQVIGFACYDATAKGFFGPIGVTEGERKSGVGKALLLNCLHAMAWDGYGYAVIGWCDGAAEFYAHTVSAIPIPASGPSQSVYGRMF